MPSPPPRLCWVVTDGRRGIENQALGLAEAVGRLTPLVIERRHAPARETLRLSEPRREDLKAPAGPGAEPGEIAPLALKGTAAGPAEGPDLWISCGRASLPYAERARRWFDVAPLVVQLQDPKRPLEAFDLVVPPLHDRLDGPNVFPIIGSPNRISDQRLAAGARAFAKRADAPPAPRAAVLIGGDSKRHRLSQRVIPNIMFVLERARAEGWSLLVTTSRRTPATAVETLRERFGRDPGVWLWTDETDGGNPYDAFLAAADIVLVTKDSTNMITEAAAAGKPVLLLPVDGVDGKFAALYAALARRGNARLFAGDLAPWPVEPLRETERAAEEVLRQLDARGRVRAESASS